MCCCCVFFFKQKTAYEMRISDWSSDVCSSDLSDEIVVAVRHLLRARMHESPALGDIAAELHLTERTLRRQLLAAGSGFRILHDEVRSERARELLRGSDLPIAQVGASVGFRDAREFRRAFKRWTGTTPSAMRATP